MFELYRIVDKIYPLISLPLIIAFIIGVVEYTLSRKEKRNSRFGMRLIIGSVLILLLVSGIYVLIGTIIGTSGEVRIH